MPSNPWAGNLRQEPLLAERAVRTDRKGPDVPLHAFVDVERRAVRTQVDAVGRAEPLREEHDGAVGVDPPELPRAGLPVRVAGVERAVGGDREVIGLVHPRLVREDDGVTPARRHLEHVVVDIVGDEHRAVGGEADAIADARARQREIHLGRPVGCHPADRALPCVIDREHRSFAVAGRAAYSANNSPMRANTVFSVTASGKLVMRK